MPFTLSIKCREKEVAPNRAILLLSARNVSTKQTKREIVSDLKWIRCFEIEAYLTQSVSRSVSQYAFAPQTVAFT
jgi:hypothetical protein